MVRLNMVSREAELPVSFRRFTNCWNTGLKSSRLSLNYKKNIAADPDPSGAKMIITRIRTES